jgi:sialidase-1
MYPQSKTLSSAMFQVFVYSRFFLVICVSFFSSGLCHAQRELSYIFTAGQEGYACFRIPAVVTTGEGHLLAFAEGRKNGCSDTGAIDLVLKRSEDGGKSWGPLEIVWQDGDNTCGNPAPVVEQESGDILLLATWNLGEDREAEIIAQTSRDTRRVYLLRSTDNGKSWGVPQEITSDVKAENWTWYATGPGSGIQLQQGPYSGRLMIACDHIEAETKKYYSHVIYSDDRGKNWQIGGITPKDQVNECEVVQLGDGKLLLNMRNYDRTKRSRQLAYSHDGGNSWTDMQHSESLVEPICQASMLRFDAEEDVYILFSNPASTEGRVNMTLKANKNGGQDWQTIEQIHAGPSAYSDLVRLGEWQVGLLFEAGRQGPYEGVAWQQIDLQGRLP